MCYIHSQRAALLAIRTAFAGVLLAAVPTGDAQQVTPASAAQIRVLFIGNSLTYVNDLPAELQAMIAAAYPGGPALRYEAVTPPGRTLEQQWNEGKAATKIAEGHWDYVIVQEQSQIPFTERAKVFQYARLFDREIKRVGAKTVLYMTFPLKKKFDDGDLLPEIYTSLGKELGATVVPVDVAWHEAAKRNPQLVLYNRDGVHPAPVGTYLAACCFAETLWGQPPFPAQLRRAGQDRKLLVELTQQQADELQKAAAAVVTPAASAPRAVAVDSTNPAAPESSHPSAKPGAWVDLFNGKDTTGWNDDQSLWKVENGILIGTGGQGYLDTRRSDFTNFHIRVEAMINDRGNSGVLFRAYPSASYEAQIEANGDDKAKTGSLYIYNGKRYSAPIRLTETPVPANQWFTMDVVADGFHITILVDGKKVGDYIDHDQISASGLIRLQVANPQTLVKFRKVQIQELAN